MKKGLQKLPSDSRDFQLGFITRLPSLQELPYHLQLESPDVRDQKETDYCSAYAFTSANELQEDVLFSPEWHFAVSKEISGDVNAWGQNLRDAAKVLTKYGSLPQKHAEMGVDDENAREIDNWNPKHKKTAQRYRKKSYVAVTGPYDMFDNIRATLYKFKKENRGIAIGLLWRWNIKEKKLEMKNKGYFGHAMLVTGYDGDYLIVQNSAGREAGYGGLHFIHKDVINTDVPQYGAFMLVDLSPEDIEKGITLEDNWFIRLIKILQSWLTSILS